MVVMISQPMSGKSVEQIRQEREGLVNLLTSEGHTVVDTVFEIGPPTVAKEDHILNFPLYHLSESIRLMSECEAVVFMPKWEKARGCQIEHNCCVQYGLKPIYWDGSQHLI